MDPLAQVQSLGDRVAKLTELVERIQMALPTVFCSDSKQEDVVALVKDAVLQGNSIQADASQAFSDAELARQWTDRAGLLALLDAAQTVLKEKKNTASRQRLRRLADELETGNVTHQLPKVRERLNGLRQQAAKELRGSADSDIQGFDGPPDAVDWLDWFWSLGDAAEITVEANRTHLVVFAEFLEHVTREQWQPDQFHSATVNETDCSYAKANVAEAISTAKPEMVVEAASSDSSHDSTRTVQSSPSPLPGMGHRESLDQPAEAGKNDTQFFVASIEQQEFSIDAKELSDSKRQVESTATPTLVAPAAVSNEEVASFAAKSTISQTTHTVSTPPILAFDDASFDEFCKHHWIAPNGICEAAPWRYPGFTDDLVEALFRALQDEQFGRAGLFAAAAVQLKCEAVPTPDEVRAWAKLWLRPREAIGLGPHGVWVLRTAAEEGRLDSGRVWKFRLCQEALRPSCEQPLRDCEAKKWVEAAGFDNGLLREMLLLLLRIGRATDHPIGEIRRMRKAEGVSVDNLTHILESKRKEFHTEVRRVWSAAGGKVKLTHCRRAWDEFIAQIKATLAVMYPQNQGGKSDWKPEDISRQINRFQKVHKDIADRWEAKYRERHTMDRTAESIATAAAEINDLYRRTKTAEVDQKVRSVSDEEMAKWTELFLRDPSGEDPFEECCRRLILRHIDYKTGAEPRNGLMGDDLLAYPALLGCVVADPGLLSVSSADEVIPFTDIVAPAAAAAIMFQPAMPLTPLSQGENLVDRLAQLVLPLRRYDLLAPLVSHLAQTDKAKARTARNDVDAETVKVYGQVRQTLEKLGGLAYPRSATLERLLKDAASRIKSASTKDGARPGEQLLVKGWMERLAVYAKQLLTHAVDSFRLSVSNDGHSAETDILRALDEQRYADAVFLRSGPSATVKRPAAAKRQTSWRKLAWSQFADPDEALRNFRKNFASARVQDLVCDFKGNYAACAYSLVVWRRKALPGRLAM